MKLDAVQKMVIGLMRDGFKFTLTGINNIVVSWTGQMEMIKMGLIKESKSNPFIYELTELGKTIEL